MRVLSNQIGYIVCMQTGSQTGGICLIGESDPFIAQLLQRFAEEIGIQVVFAQVGEELLEASRISRPTMIILDPDLPGLLRGWEAGRKICRDDNLQSVPIITCSWLSEAEARDLIGKTAGHLQKQNLHFDYFLQLVQNIEFNPPSPLLLEVRGLKKAFPGVQALNGVNFDLRPGEVHALVGENGAGKSTLIKILSGAYSPDEGKIMVDGQEYQGFTPHQAQALGIRTIYQERNLVPDLTVAENILLGDLPGKSFLVNWAMVRKETQAILNNLDLDLNPDTPVANLGVAKQQAVEIAKALYQKARVVIMDEPTSAFGRTEVERLFSTVRTLRQQGIGIIYISHHLEEIFAISDRVTVLRDGLVVGSRKTSRTSPQELMNMMVGRDLSGISIKEEVVPGEVLLKVENLTHGDIVQKVSFDLRRGEILGIAGMVGSGRTEMSRLIFGVDKPDSGRIIYKNVELHISSPKYAIRNGIGLVPEDRKLQGLVLCLDIPDNVSMVSLNNKKPLLNLKQIQDNAWQYMSKLDISASATNREVQYLSGGNQQKVVLAKWLEAGTDLLIIDEPTRGVDVGAKLEIHRLLANLAKQGKAILMVSSDLPEILALSDRILVMHKGRVVGELNRDEATETKIISLALGENDANHNH